MSLLESPVAVPSTTTGHDWRVVAPWYRWSRSDGLEPERDALATKPALHMFGSTDFVEDFLADPQRSLRFDPTHDVRQSYDLLDSIPIDPRTGKKKLLSNRVKTNTDLRKLFLPAHQRFYVVAAALHCDQPGFPRVAEDGVGEVGFVIRRRRVDVEGNQKKEAANLLKDLAIARATANHRARFETVKQRSRILHPFRSTARSRVGSGTVAALRAYEDLAAAERKVKVWAQLNGVESTSEAWVPTGNGTFGAWLPIADEPDELIETVYPMRLLAPDPNDPDHAAHDGPIWWAHIPTASDEVTADGSARFNENECYEIRVFARQAGSCPGEPVWSEASEPFSLAGFHDPDGCGQRPLEIRLPDFRSLQATTAKPSVKMTTPPGSSITNVQPPAADAQGGLDDQGTDEICFFFIPLITIVAMFLLNIFLPIIVFVFNLWWMLALKFCIPPSIDFDVDLTAALDVEPPVFEIDAEFDFDVHIATNPGTDAAAVDSALLDIFTNQTKAYQVETAPFGAEESDFDMAPELTDQFSPHALIRLAIAQGNGPAGMAGAPNFDTEPVYTSRVERHEVIHP